MANFLTQFGNTLTGFTKNIPVVGGVASNILGGLTQEQLAAEQRKRNFELAKLEAMRPTIVQQPTTAAPPPGPVIQRQPGFAPGLNPMLLIAGLGIFAVVLLARK